MSEEMSNGVKGLGLIFGGYVVTIIATILIIALTIIIFIDTTKCSVVTRAIAVLWGTIAVVFIASFVIVGKAARKVILDDTKRRIAMVLYGVFMLPTYVVIAFVIMVIFNC